jgi:hypothetical protein
MDAAGTPAHPADHIAPGASAPGDAPRPLLAAPDVRMAYLYEWIDESGNRHFGGWVAIPLGGFDWVMGDGSQESVESREAPREVQ